MPFECGSTTGSLIIIIIIIIWLPVTKLAGAARLTPDLAPALLLGQIASERSDFWVVQIPRGF